MIYKMPDIQSISGLVVEYIVAIDVTRVRFPADASLVPVHAHFCRGSCYSAVCQEKWSKGQIWGTQNYTARPKCLKRAEGATNCLLPCDSPLPFRQAYTGEKTSLQQHSVPPSPSPPPPLPPKLQSSCSGSPLGRAATSQFGEGKGEGGGGGGQRPAALSAKSPVHPTSCPSSHGHA